MESVLTQNPTALPSLNEQFPEWTCTICNRSMGLVSQRSHLLGKKHKEMVESYGEQEKHQELLAQQPDFEEVSQPNKYSLGDLPEVGLQGSLVLAGTSSDPVLSRLREKQEVEYYGTFRPTPQPQPQYQNITTSPTPGLTKKTRIAGVRIYRPPSNPWVEPEELDPPSAALIALRTAQYIENFKDLKYPDNILPPAMAFKPVGTFLYEREFILQFQSVFTEKPTVNWDKKMHWAIGELQSRAQTARTPSGLGPRSTTRPDANSALPMGTFCSFKHTIDRNMTSEQRFERSRVKSQLPKIFGSFKGGITPANNLASMHPSEQWRPKYLPIQPFEALKFSPPIRQPEGPKHIGAHQPEDADSQETLEDPSGSPPGFRKSGNRSSRGNRGVKKQTLTKLTQPLVLVVTGALMVHLGVCLSTTLQTNQDPNSISKDDRNERPPIREQYPIPDKPPYTAHVGNLAPDITEENISEFFSQCDFMKVKLIRNKDDDHFRGFGYAQFNTKEGLIAAMKLNNIRLSGRNIRINIAKPPTRPSAPLGNLPAKTLNPTEVMPIAVLTTAKPRPSSAKTWRDLVVRPPPDLPVEMSTLQNHVHKTALKSSSPEEKGPSRTAKGKWHCEVCACTTGLDRKEIHLAGVKHAENLRRPQ